MQTAVFTCARMEAWHTAPFLCQQGDKLWKWMSELKEKALLSDTHHSWYWCIDIAENDPVQKLWIQIRYELGKFALGKFYKLHKKTDLPLNITKENVVTLDRYLVICVKVCKMKMNGTFLPMSFTFLVYKVWQRSTEAHLPGKKQAQASQKLSNLSYLTLLCTILHTQHIAFKCHLSGMANLSYRMVRGFGNLLWEKKHE